MNGQLRGAALRGEHRFGGDRGRCGREWGHYFLSIASRSLTCSLTFSRMFFGTPE